jgi:nitroimidazol reductase NimA-like FMN-containing flavoprotein (pyridoxamine 5'-phosphate oxidase superfamily)
MQDNKLTQEARQLIAEIPFLTLATADSSGVPWCTPVNTAYDSCYRFYWASAIDTQHSQNIRQNSRTGAVIYNSSLAEGSGQAVYMDGHAYELTPDTWMSALDLLRTRSSHPDKFYPRDYYNALRDIRIYTFIPEAFFMLQPGGDTRFEAYAACRTKIELT